MNTPNNGARYDRRLTDPLLWPSSRFGRRAEEETRRRVNELSWSLAGEQVAAEALAYLGAQSAREERRRAARDEGWRVGEPGE